MNLVDEEDHNTNIYIRHGVARHKLTLIVQSLLSGRMVVRVLRFSSAYSGPFLLITPIEYHKINDNQYDGANSFEYFCNQPHHVGYCLRK